MWDKLKIVFDQKINLFSIVYLSNDSEKSNLINEKKLLGFFMIKNTDKHHGTNLFQKNINVNFKHVFFCDLHNSGIYQFIYWFCNWYLVNIACSCSDFISVNPFNIFNKFSRKIL